MEKILIKPTSKEIIFKNDEPGTHFDAFCYEGSNLQEKSLGALFVVGQVKYGDENLGYLVNLIASLAKREYYANVFVADQTAKTAFENTLKKLNEVLEDFFRNKQFKLSVGLASVAGDNILISRIGNIKFSLARKGDYIDVLNNIELFDKEHLEEKEFSNVLSGKIQPQDKLFMYLPSKSVSSREKTLRELFKKEPQAVFAKKLEELSQTAANFTCCGIHMEINSVKEIPVQSRPSYYTPTSPKQNEAAALAASQAPVKAVPSPVVDDAEDEDSDPRKDLKGYRDLPQPHIIPADVSLARRKSVMASLAAFASSVNPAPMMKGGRGKYKMFIGIAVAVLLLAAGSYFFVFHGSADSVAIKQAKENLKQAQEKVSQNDYRSARSLIDSSLAFLADKESKAAQQTRDELNQLLKSIDKTSDKTPAMLWDLSSQGKKLNNILASVDGLFVLDGDGNFNKVEDNNLTSIGKISIQSADFVFDGSKDALLLNSDAHGAIISKTTGKGSDYSLDDTTELKGGAVYADNLYAISGGSIVKFTDATLGKTVGTAWSKDSISNAIGIAADGNVYVLTSDGKISVYFTGEKKGEFELNVTPGSGASIFTLKDLPFIYLIDRTNKKVMVFDKSSGALQLTYSLASLGTAVDVSITKDQEIYILSGDNKIYQIK